MKIVQRVFKNQDIKYFVNNSIFLGFFKALSLPIALLFSVIISRWYGSEAMGIYGISMSIIAILTTFGTIGIETAMPRLIPHNDKKLAYPFVIGTSIIVVLVSGLFLSLVLYWTAEWISISILKDSRLIFPIQICALFIPLINIAKICSAYLLASKRIKDSESIYKILVPLVGLLIILISFIYRHTYYIPVWAFLISQGIGAFLGIWTIYGKNKIKFSASIKKAKNILSITGPITIASIAGMVVLWSDTLMLGYFGTTHDVGIYTIIFKVAALLLLPFHIALPGLGPQIVEFFWSDQKKRLKKLLKFTTLLFFGIGVILYSIIFFFSKEILSIFGSEFIVGAFTLKIVSLTYLITLFFSLNGFIANNCGMEKISKNIAVGTAVTNIVLNVFLIPHYGIVGAAIASLLSFTLSNVILSYFIYKLKNIRTWVSL